MSAARVEITKIIAEELNVRENQVAATIALLDDGSTIPFIARYRKEATGGLDDIQLRNLGQRLTYLRELDDRRQVITKSIADQEKLTPELANAINNCLSKTELEDLYLPFKPKRRTKGQIAIEAGLEPLAETLITSEQNPESLAIPFINPEAGFADEKTVLEGARFILMERFAEDAQLLKAIRAKLWQQASLEATVIKGKETEGAKFRDYFSYQEPIHKVPSHRALALLRGRNEGILQVKLNPDPEQETSIRESQYEPMIGQHFKLNTDASAAGLWRKQSIQWTWRVKILPRMETDLFGQLRELAEAAAIDVFARNLKDLLMSAPAGLRPTLGLDPGLRTGVKATVVDGTGKLLANSTIFPHAPQNQWDKSIRTLAALCKQHKVELVAIGNGTASRETDKLVSELMAANPELTLTKVMVNESGASVYSASELASQEFPDLDVSYRGAVSIARRLQDPLAELVKIEPKAIGVGQYQHDVSQSYLATSLDAVVEDCVNAVGVDVNTASVPLLARVAGLNRNLAQNIVHYREQTGTFNARKDLLSVPRMGPKSYEQAAGFLRIMAGKNPLDGSAVHPEAYPIAERIAAANQRDIANIIGDSGFLQSLSAQDYTDDEFGLPTVMDIIRELEKPGRDPRPEFKTAEFREGVENISDLQIGMTLEGVVTNVTNFGAFVDIGVHQDGLVHISALSDTFVKDPHDIVKAGEVVKVKVMEVDAERKRIALSMRLQDPVASNPPQDQAAQNNSSAQKPRPKSRPQQGAQKARKPAGDKSAPINSAFADAFAKAKKR
ncbi:RNA-binding transcriptional accessory protein [Aliidiomarina iranensis]|uniref:RNA-binding transcriptional accessory protein n=1 Tax=Aliidiomarina iranensis TaxID=1434071 RepID=A0A432W2D7_9GAMM|nr:Tex family protein [Aliidiomarina iranensis]RUO23402.1 RNA-binding transcriptional accessory protein [Aliidiomarina iranensis]